MGGAERSIVSNVPLHIQNGIEMDVLVLDGTEFIFFKKLKEQNINIISLANINVYNPLIIFKLRKIITDYDIVHAHLFPSLYLLAIANWINKKKVKLVYTEHSTHNRRRKIKLFKHIDKIIYKQYDAIITISNATNLALNDYLKNTLKKGRKIINISNGVDLNSVKKEASKEKKFDFEKIKNSKIILQISGFRPAKDQDTLIRALKNLPTEFHVIFVGDGERINLCKQLALQMGVSSRVWFLGEQENVGAIINKADLVVMSSHWEGFGRAAIEGMALGKPVLASDVSGLRDIVFGAGILFAPGNTKQLSELILKLLTDEKLYRQISECCLKRASEYDIANMINDYEQVYCNVLE
tara:strand:- start:822 stop:1883 length:1062 start_codon:yes stop_codon:yes gene_type:complete